MILIVDNYDSFVHNLARYVREAGGEVSVVRHDQADLIKVQMEKASHVIISPGPNAPEEAGLCLPLIAALPPGMPLLGVCLGHQCLVEALGGKTVRARRPLHGEATPFLHDGTGILKDVPSPTPVGRYHSLIADVTGADEIVVTGYCDEGEVMSVCHQKRPWFGMQFHPESLLTPMGRTMIENFLRVPAR
ncbi:MAG: aminodeoxychorismate/anthranilate synthase component II [Pseudomonadota bacterium]